LATEREFDYTSIVTASGGAPGFESSFLQTERFWPELAITNAIESRWSTVERVERNAKRWREGDQPLRRTATGLLEAETKQLSYTSTR